MTMGIGSIPAAANSIAQDIVSHGTESEVYKYARAVFMGPAKGLGELAGGFAHAIMHPDKVFYSMYELVYDAAIICALQDHFDLYENEIRRHIGQDSIEYQEAVTRMQFRIDQLKEYGSQFASGSGPDKLEMGLSLGTTVLAPGWILKGAQAAARLHRLGTLEPPIMFHDVLKDISNPQPIVNVKAKDIRNISGRKKFLFVADEAGHLVVTSEESAHPFMRNGKLVTRIKHADAARLLPVSTAGELIVVDGKVTRWTNESGRYLAKGVHLEKFTENIFVKHGFHDAVGKFEDVSLEFHGGIARIFNRYPRTSQAGPLTPYPNGFGVAAGSLAAFGHRFSPLNVSQDQDIDLPSFPFFIDAAYAKERIDSEANDQQKIQKIKSLLAQEPNGSDERVKKAKLIEKEINEMSDPEGALNRLRPSELRKLEKWADECRIASYPTLIESVSTAVDSLNAIVNPVTLERVTRHADGKTDPFTAQGLPLLHTAFNIFRLVNPKEAQRTALVIENGGSILEGGAGVFHILATQGVAGIATSGFALFAGLVVNGVLGLTLSQGQDSQNKELLLLRQGLSNQIDRVHIDVLEGFRMTSIALGIIKSDVGQGFLRQEMLSQQQHQELMVQLQQLKRFLYIDGLYIEEIKKMLGQNERYHIQQQIENADWKDVHQEVIRQCKTFPKSMSPEDFIRLMDQIGATLKKVQRDGIARAEETAVNDEGRVQNLLSTANSRVGSKQPRTLSDNYRLQTEQNIHLLVKFLNAMSEKWGIKSNFPSLESLYNPAAVYDLSEAAQLLLQTYRNTSFYLGTPQEPTRETLNLLDSAIQSHKLLVKAMGDIAPALIDDYVAELRTFTDHYVRYEDHLMMKYYGQNAQPRLSKVVKESGLALTGMDIGKRSEFFKMDGWKWWYFVWSHFYEGPNHWSMCGDNVPCYGYSDRPDWIPKDRIEDAKRRYRNEHHLPAETIHQKRVKEHQVKADKVEKNAHLEHPSFKEAVLQFIRYDNFTLDQWSQAPYQFFNHQTVLPVSDWYLSQLPRSVFPAFAAGIGDLQFTWKEVSGGHIELNAILQMNSDNFPRAILLFNQTVGPLAGHAQKLGLLESLHYTWFGGHLPLGECGEFDLDLNRYATKDTLVQDYRDYNAGKARYDCPPGRCHHPGYRATICYPKTEAVSGLYSFDDANMQKSAGQFNRFPMIRISDMDKETIETALHQKMRQIRTHTIHDISHVLRTQNPKALDADPNLPDSLKKDFLPSFNRLSAKARALKMDLSYTVPSNVLSFDTSWPNIFEGDDILRELDQFFGQRVFLETLLRLNAEQLEAIKQAIVEAIQEKPVEQYPFTHFEEDFQKIREETERRHLVLNVIAKSAPQNLQQLEQLPSLLAKLPTETKQQLASINPPLQDVLKPANDKPELPSPQVQTQTPDRLASQTSSATRAAPFYMPFIHSIYQTASNTFSNAFNWFKSDSKTASNNKQVWPIKTSAGRSVDQSSYSTFLQPLSNNDKLQIIDWVGRCFIFPLLPWNREHILSPLTKESLEQFSKDLLKLEESYNETDDLNDADEINILLKDTKQNITTALKSKKISSSTLAEIQYRISYLSKKIVRDFLFEDSNVLFLKV